MKKKRIWALVLTFAMLISLIPSVVFAAEEVVQIESNGGTYKCASLTDAVAAAGSGDTLRLIANDTKKQQVTIDKSLTIELDGHSLTDTSLKVSGSGVNVSLNDSVGGAKINKNRYKGFKMENGSNTLQKSTATVYVTGGAALKINGVTGTDENTGTIIYDCATDELEKAVLVDGSTLEVNGGTFVAVDDSGRNSLFVYNGNVTVNDGYFYTAISFDSDPTSQYPFVVKKCTIYGGIWVEELGKFLTLDEIETIILAQSPGSSATEDTKNDIIKITDASEKATADWLNTSGNELYVGEIKVTADNAANIIDGTTADVTGKAHFKVENSVPTLCLDGVTIKDGHKEKDTVSSLGNIYKIYGIYYNPASGEKLTIKLSGTNVIEPKIYTDEVRKSALTYGIIAKDYEDAALMIEGSENASLKISSIQRAISAKNGVSVKGGTYTIATDNGEDEVSGQGIYADGTVEIDNATMNITARRNCGIEMGSGDDKTIIKNSNLTVVGDTTGNGIDGIQSFGDLFIENSIVNVTGDGNGINMSAGAGMPVGSAITISGENTVVKAKSVNAEEDRGYRQAAILLNKGFETYDEEWGGYIEGKMPEFTLNDGLAVTTPESGRIDKIDNDYKSVLDTNGDFAREVVIKAPITHCVCGEINCTDTAHTGTIKHIADNSLNLIEDITTDGAELSDGSYYLSGDLAVSAKKNVLVTGNVNICLNGHKLEANIVPKDNAVLNICDCSSDKSGTITNSVGHVIAFRYNKATANIYGGTLESSYDGGNTIIDFEQTADNVLNLYGGTVKYSGNDTSTAIGSRDLAVNLYGGEVVTTKANGIVALGTIKLCGNTKITVPTGYDSIKLYKGGCVDASGYTGDGNISILCDGSSEKKISDRDIVVKNVNDTTAAKFVLSSKNSKFVLKRVGDDLVYLARFTVLFDSNGGGGTMNGVIIESGDYTLPECGFSAPVNKVFKAWEVDGKEYAPGSVIDVSKDNTIVKALWADKETVRVSEAPQTFVYDRQPKGFEIKNSNVSGGFNIKYKKDGTDVAAPIDAGEYDVIITRAADDTYTEFSLTIPRGLVITPRDIKDATYGAFAKMTYNGAAQTPSAVVTIDGLLVTGSWNDVTKVSDKTTFTASGNFTGTIADVSPKMEKAAQVAPSASAVAETIKGKADGKITGVDDNMEYRADGANEYTAVVGNTIENLSAGTYFMRYKETENYLASEDVKAVIAAGEMITVTFDSNGGSAVDSAAYEYNQSVLAPTDPTKDGFEFVGWFTDREFTDKWDFESDKVTASITLYAKWVQGIVSDDENNIDGVEVDGLNDVAKNENADIVLVVKDQEPSDDNDKQTAIKAIEGAPDNFGFYDITLEKSTGGTVDDAASVIEIKIPYDFAKKTNIKVYRHHGGAVQELAALGARAVKGSYEDGKYFADTNNGCIYIYSSKFSIYSVAYDTVRTSSGGGGGGIVRYTVKFDANGAGIVNSQRVAKGGTAAKPDEIKKDGYTFGGWYLDTALTEEYDFSTKVTSNITLYAKWIEDTKGGEDTDNNKDSDNSGKDNSDNTNGGSDADTHNCPSKDFDDLDTSLWYHGDMDYVLSNGLMNGTADKTFAPNENLTRAMLVTILYRNEGKPEISGSAPFEDVAGGAYYADAVDWAYKNGIVKGISETMFAPDNNITREQIAAIMYRYAQYKGYDTTDGENTNILSYNDFDSISEYAIGAMQYACGSGLIKGRTESTLNPNDNATRAEIAAVLHRFIENNK